MKHSMHDVLLIAVMAGVTALLRAMPFLLFPEGRPVPRTVQRLSSILPYAVIGMLVVYCFKSINVFTSPFGLPELIAGALVAVLYIWKRSTLLSITAGTVCYMLLVQVVFAV